jgi:hypothetical protein
MKRLSTALIAIFAVALAVPAFAAPYLGVGAPSGIQLVQKADKEKGSPPGHAAGDAGTKHQPSKDTPRSNKGGETRGKDRANDVQEMNQAKKAQ